MVTVIYKPMWSLSNYLITLKRKEDILIVVGDLPEYRSGSLHSDPKQEQRCSKYFTTK